MVVFGKMAESCANYLAKGRLTAINGRIQTSTYDKNDGSKGYKTEIMASKVEFIDWGDKEKPSAYPQQQQIQAPSNPKQKTFSDSDDPFGDDVFEPADDDYIPF